MYESLNVWTTSYTYDGIIIHYSTVYAIKDDKGDGMQISKL